MHVTDAIILRKEELGEADLLITALTDRFVNIRLIAQGARKVEAKLKGHLEPLSLSRLSFVAGRNNYRLVGAELLNFFPAIKSDPFRLRAASEIFGAVGSALFEDRREENGNFFAVALEMLDLLNGPTLGSEEQKAGLVWFRARFLDELGLFSEPTSRCLLLPCAEFATVGEASEVRRLDEVTSRLFAEHLA